MKSTIPVIKASALDFLRQLKENNNREWFNAHKDVYQAELLSIETFIDALLERMKQFDTVDTPTGKKAMMRIYRDTRFSTDKTPYKINWSGGFHRAGEHRRGGYYFHFQPGGESLIAGGFWGPESADLKMIRDEFAFDDQPIRKILALPEIRNQFGGLTGEALKTIPRGYAADNPAADLLRYKQLILERKFTDEEVLADDFIDKAAATLKAFQPFFDYMSEILTPAH